MSCSPQPVTAFLYTIGRDRSNRTCAIKGTNQAGTGASFFVWTFEIALNRMWGGRLPDDGPPVLLPSQPVQEMLSRVGASEARRSRVD
jgi:hypothetical protein